MVTHKPFPRVLRSFSSEMWAAGVQVATLGPVLVWLKGTGMKPVLRADFQPVCQIFSPWNFLHRSYLDLLPKPVQSESSMEKDKERPKIDWCEMWLSVSITQSIILICKDHHFLKYSLVLVLNRLWQNHT